MNFLRLKMCLILVGISLESIGQTAKSEPIFGSVVERKTPKDSTKKKSSFNILKPAFLRVGVIGGRVIGYENSTTEKGGTSGIRVEYGISNRWSIVGEVARNSTEGTTFSRGQASLGINWMPFKSRRLQPFFGLSGGVGGDGSRGRQGDGRYGRGSYGVYESNFIRNNQTQGFGIVRTGLNYVILNKIIATAEAGYQFPLSTSISSGGLSLRVGGAYQFGKMVKK